MGTTYNIVVVGGDHDLSETELRNQMETVFANVNAKMSNWDKQSEVSQFNKTTQTTPFPASKELMAVMCEANKVHRDSNGMFDVTLGPLIELWGFGTRKPETPVPSDDEIATARRLVGQSSNLVLDKDARTITKSQPGVQVNLSALAKGYGIDAAANRLAELGFENYLVEIGGDLRTAGKNEHGTVWRVGIEKPEVGSRELKKIVSVGDLGMATSGDYRNFVEVDGKRYSHIIDPTTGYPIKHPTTSVTVIAASAMKADAWATALLALGSNEGLKIANENNIAAYFISRDRDLSSNEYVIEASNAFEKLDKAH